MLAFAMRITLSLLLLASIASATPTAPKPSLLDELRGRFERAPEQAKTKLACKVAWTELPSHTPQGKPYTLLTCPPTNDQLYVMNGNVVSIGGTLAVYPDLRRSDAVMKDSRADLVAAKCKLVMDRNQMVIYDCPNHFAVTLLSNWNSKDDTHSVSTLFGPSESLLPMLGLK